MAGLVLREDRDGLATLTLNRPEKLNSLNVEMFVELRAHVDQIARETDRIGLVVVRGAGKCFSAGHDLADIAKGERPPKPNFQSETIERLADLPQPVISAVHGHCYTGALELALAGDLIVAAESAKFADTHARWALTPIWGMSQRLPRRVGPSKAREMMLTCRTYSGVEAAAMGLANICVPDDSFDKELARAGRYDPRQFVVQSSREQAPADRDRRLAARRRPGARGVPKPRRRSRHARAYRRVQQQVGAPCLRADAAPAVETGQPDQLQPPDEDSSERRGAFRALRHRNYRLYFFGQLTSLAGTWMQSAAQAWLVLKLTNSATMLGVVSFAQFTPILLVGLFAGVMVDRVDRRRLIITTQILLMLSAFTLAALTWTGTVRVEYVILLAAFNGTVGSFDMPGRQSFVVEMVGYDDLANAIALNSMMFNSARMLGPAAAGLLIAWLGIGTCFFLNGVSFLAVIWSLTQMDIPARVIAGSARACFINCARASPMCGATARSSTRWRWPR